MTKGASQKVENDKLQVAKGLLLEEEGDLEGALDFYKKARVQSPYNWDLYFNAARILIESKRPQEASHLLKDLIFISSHLRFDKTMALSSSQKQHAFNMLNSVESHIANEKRVQVEETAKQQNEALIRQIEQNVVKENRQIEIDLPEKKQGFFGSIFPVFGTRPRVVPVSAPRNDKDRENENRNSL